MQNHNHLGSQVLTFVANFLRDIWKASIPLSATNANTT